MFLWYFLEQLWGQIFNSYFFDSIEIDDIYMYTMQKYIHDS